MEAFEDKEYTCNAFLDFAKGFLIHFKSQHFVIKARTLWHTGCNVILL